MTFDNEHIKKFCNEFAIQNWNIGENGLLYVDENVFIYDETRDKLVFTELPIKFGRVNGYFDCEDNRLTTFKGFPYEIGDDLYCRLNCFKTRPCIFNISVYGKIVSDNLWKF